MRLPVGQIPHNRRRYQTKRTPPMSYCTALYVRDRAMFPNVRMFVFNRGIETEHTFQLVSLCQQRRALRKPSRAKIMWVAYSTSPQNPMASMMVYNIHTHAHTHVHILSTHSTGVYVCTHVSEILFKCFFIALLLHSVTQQRWYTYMYY